MTTLLPRHERVRRAGTRFSGGRWGTIGWRRGIALITAVLLVAVACGGSGDDGGPSDGTPPSTLPDSSSLGEVLTSAGFDIISEPGAGTGSRLELWDYQVTNMWREIQDGGGYLGVQLDELVGDPGGLPFSYLLAGWITASPTAAAEEARDLMGDQDWTQAPAIVFPTAVLMMFVGDAVQAGAPAPSAMSAVEASMHQTGVCSTLSGWVNSALDYVFDSLKVQVDDMDFLGWLGTIWNAAVDLAKGVVTATIEALLAPVISLISDGLAVLGTLGMVASILKPWNVTVKSSNAETRFALGDEPDFEEAFTATVDTGIEFDWPASVEDCARVAGLELPDPSKAEGSTVSWEVAGLPPFGSVTEMQPGIDEDNQAQMMWVTGREDSELGDEIWGTVSVSATVESKQIDELEAMLAGLIADQVPVPPFGDLVRALFSALTEPVFEKLAELVQVNGTSSASVLFHDTSSTAGPIMGTTWRLETNRVVDLEPGPGQALKPTSAIIMLQLDPDQDPTDPMPRYLVTGGTVTYEAFSVTDAAGCTTSGSEIQFEITPDLAPVDPDAEFSRNYLYFDTTKRPIEYWGIIDVVPGASETAIADCTGVSDVGPHSVDFTQRANAWLVVPAVDKLPIVDLELIEGERLDGDPNGAFTRHEWTLTRVE
jgi:hypothetical protein